MAGPRMMAARARDGKGEEATARRGERGRTWRGLAAFVLAAVSLAVVPLGAASDNAGASPPVASVLTHRITATDGTTMLALVAQPGGPGPHPLIVMPSSWALNHLEYTVVATQWAAKGYVVISYTSRGFWESDGLIDIAGELTVRDMSTVIDWAGANTTADLERVGGVGISYGAGISLLAAARDPRIDAVVAFSGWVDFAESMVPNGTSNRMGAELLLAEAHSTGRPGPLLLDLEERLNLEVPDNSRIFEVSAERSPNSYLDELAANDTAVMISSGWHDSFFAPSQFIGFFEDLETNKKLVLSPGDHAMAEGLGVLGLPNARWDEAFAWVERHVAGHDVDTGSAVTVVTADTRRTLHAETWDGLSTVSREFNLTAPSAPRWFNPAVGGLVAHPSGAWSTSVRGGYATGANSGNVYATAVLQTWLHLPISVVPDWVNRTGGAVWETERLSGAETIAGEVRLDVTVTSTSEDTTFFAYLYEEGPWGVANLITHEPFTILDVAPGQPTAVSVTLEPMAWDLARGSRLVLIIDTEDPRYYSATEPGATVTFSSGPDAPSRLLVPIRS